MNKLIKFLTRIFTLIGIFVFSYSTILFFVKDLGIAAAIGIVLTFLISLKYGMKIEKARWAIHFLGCYSIPFIMYLVLKNYTDFTFWSFIWIPVISIIMIFLGYYIERMQAVFSKYDFIADIIGAIYPVLIILATN